MLAIACRWDGIRREPHDSIANRLASSLCAGIGGYAGAAHIDGFDFAYRALRSNAATARAWRPATLASGHIVVFHGYFDNASEIATRLDTPPDDHSRLYGLAVEQWGDDADLRIIGNYCAVIADPSDLSFRLSRSPLTGPPLYYAQDCDRVAIASVPRALFAAGVEQRLNEVRLADGALSNFSDLEATWFENVAQIPTGSIVELRRNRPRVLRKYYDLLDVPDRRRVSDAEALTKVRALLDEGVRACLHGFRRPGATLSAGLDSPQVAVSALTALSAHQKLPTFTFHPEPEFDGRVPRGMMGDERPFVESFAALHPRLEPHFTANEGYGPDHRLNELFHLTGSAPAHMATMYVLHGVMSEAVKAHCDLMLLAEWGNLTFSDKGESGFVEYLITGRWRQWWLALRRPAMHTGSMSRRFIARFLSALLPNRLWAPLRRIVLRKELLFEHMQPLSTQYRRLSGADDRLKRAGWIPDRYQPWTRRHSRRLLFEHDSWKAEFYQGLEQMYGIALRDPTAYRPLVEFCVSLPTEMFLRDGEMRWLAKQMAKGIMPDEQRMNPLTGWWDADWHVRIGRRREEMLLELDRLEQDERMSGMFDVARLRAALQEWPAETETDPQQFFSAQFAVPAALLTARFINYVEGRNSP